MKTLSELLSDLSDRVEKAEDVVAAARAVWVVTSPSTSRPVVGSIGVCPDRYSSTPARTPWTYGPIAVGAHGRAEWHSLLPSWWPVLAAQTPFTLTG
jgi:hypothetical protein